jgi:hypothetical protein
VAKNGPRHNKMYRYRKYHKIDVFVDFADSGVQEHLRTLRDMGMSSSDLEAQTGLSAARIRDMTEGKSRDPNRPLRRIRVDTMEMALAAYYQPPRTRGAHVPILGAQRRLQGMQADGFTYQLIADLLGREDKRGNDRVREMATGTGRPWKYIHAATHTKIATIYEQTITKWPADFGMNPAGAKATATKARKAGFVPRGCWDPDTIDDPDAFPEWTGECDSRKGYEIHIREGIPMCPQCERFENG